MDEKKKKGLNKNVIAMIFIIPLLVAIGVVAGTYFANAETPLIGESKAEDEPIQEQTVLLEEFVLNLEPGNNTGRFVRLEVALSTTQEEGLETIESNLDKIRDVIIHTVGMQTIDELFSDQNGTLALKTLLKKSINDTLDEEIIYDVYITNIVMQ